MQLKNYLALAFPIGIALAAASIGCIGGEIEGLSRPSAPLASTATVRDGFVRRVGNRFELDGRRVQLLGASARMFQGRTARRQLDASIESASSYLNVLRLWAFSDGPRREALDWEREFYFRMGPRPEDALESAYVALDRALAQARDRRIGVILTLGNHWVNYGGIQQYYEWFRGTPRPYGESRTSRVNPTDEEALFFYTAPEAKQAYQSALRSILTRTNTITGVRYAEDPTIIALELLNEPRTTEAYAEAQLSWMEEMSRYVRRLAPHHLIGSGIDTAFVRNSMNREQWIRLGGLDDIDYFDMHLYPGSSHSRDSPQSSDELEERFAEAAAYAHNVAGKPLIIGEIGFTTETAAHFQRGITSKLSRQDLLARSMRSALLRHGIDGALFWIFYEGGRERHHIHPDIPDDRRFLDQMLQLRERLPSETNGN